jgi:hypothetical protein
MLLIQSSDNYTYRKCSVGCIALGKLAFYRFIKQIWGVLFRPYHQTKNWRRQYNVGRYTHTNYKNPNEKP